VDPLGALQAAIALALFPGGIFVLVLAALIVPIPARELRLTVAEMAGILAALAAAALAPLPGSVLTTLPPPPAAGVPANLLAAAVLEAAAFALCGRSERGRASTAVALIPLVPLSMLAAGASTLSLPILVSLPGTMVIAARALIAGALLTAAPTLFAPTGRVPAASAVALASLVVLAASLSLQPLVDRASPPLVAASIAVGALVYGRYVAWVTRTSAAHPPMTVLVALQGAAGLATVLLARL